MSTVHSIFLRKKNPVLGCRLTGFEEAILLEDQIAFLISIISFLDNTFSGISPYTTSARFIFVECFKSANAVSGDGSSAWETARKKADLLGTDPF